MSDVCPVCNGNVAPQDAFCPACGFKLLGSTQEFEPISLDSQAAVSQSGPARAQTASLTVVRGPQVGLVYQLGDAELTIGRSPQCDIFLNDMTVSRDHAKVKPRGNGYYIEDLQSYNGIWINNSSVEEARLSKDDIVQIGTFCLRYSE